MKGDDHPGGDHLKLGVLYEFLPLDGVGHAPDRPRGPGPAHQGEDDRDHHVRLAGVHGGGQQGAEEEDQVQAGDEHEELGEAHDCPIREAPEVAGKSSEEDRQGQADGGGDEADGEGDAAAVHDPGKDVPSQVIGSHEEEGVGARRRGEEAAFRGDEAPEFVGFPFAQEGGGVVAVFDPHVLPVDGVYEPGFLGFERALVEAQVWGVIAFIREGGGGAVGGDELGEGHHEVQEGECG